MELPVTLRELMRHDRRALLGPAADGFEVFPWLIKLLDANDWLSVQVHPDEDAVKKAIEDVGFTVSEAPMKQSRSAFASSSVSSFSPGSGESRTARSMSTSTTA